ncbi:MAG: hypothetical protein JXB49_34165 [Bacteroidales bacterium]|nr:hypothetical protein [Bacteroidales bacterium]
MKSNIKEIKDKVYIDNIPRLEWGKNTDNSFIRSAQLTLNSLGEDYTYDFLMGISGAAFRIHFHPEFCPSSADSTTGFDVSKVLFKSLGYTCNLHIIDDKNFEEIKSLYQKIIAQINNGKPIVAINLKVCPEWGIITGYLKNKPGILCRTYFDNSDDYSLAEHAPWLSFFIGEKGEPLNIKEMFINSLKIAVQLAKTEVFEEYYSGFKAFNKWIEALQKYTDLPVNKSFDKIEENIILFNSLYDSRHSAGKYFNIINEALNLKRGGKIIDNYKKEAEILSDIKNNILPGFSSKPKDWSNEIINKQIECLKKVLNIERNVIEIIQNELNS